MDVRAITGTAVKLAVVEVLDRDGRVRQTAPVWRWPVTIGRAVDCDVVLDDVHVAAMHAKVQEVDGALRLEAGESLNGVRVQRRRLSAGDSIELTAGEVFQVGVTRLRIRRLSDALAPEQPLESERIGVGRPSPLLVGAFVAWLVGAHWVDTDPGGRLVDYLLVVLGSTIAIAGWSLLWALVSKLFRHRFDFWPHAGVALRFYLLQMLAKVGLPVAAFMFGLPFLSRIADLTSLALAAVMIAAHLTLIVPSRRRVTAVVLAILFLLGASLHLLRNYQMLDRYFTQLYVTALPPPALRLAPTVSTQQFVEEARKLESVLQRHVEESE